MMWLAGLGLSLLILLVLLFSRLNVIIHYSYKQDERNDLIYITIRLYRIQLYQKEINPLELSNQSSVWREWGNKPFLDRIRFLSNGLKTSFSQFSRKYKMVVPFMRKTQIKKLIWETECGTGTAMTSGTICGAIWAAKGMFVRLLREKTESVQDVHLNVKPHFQKEVLTTEMYCIVSITIGKAIPAFLHFRNDKKVYAKERDDTGG